MVDLAIRIVYNFSLILVIAYSYYLIRLKLGHWSDFLHQLIMGAVFGCIAMIVMTMTIEIADGYYLDSRTIILALAGYFGGPVTAIIACICTVVYRIQLGGAGLLVALFNIVIASGVGSTFYFIKRRFSSRNKSLLYMGLIMTLLYPIPVFLFDFQQMIQLYKIMAIPIMITYPVAIVFFGMVLNHSLQQREIEEERIQTNKELEQVVAERTMKMKEMNTGLLEEITARRETESALKKAEQEAIAANKMKSDFLANMSHEIRTPLNAIIGYTHLLGKTDLNDKQRSFLTKMDSSSSNLLNIVNDILDFSKIEAGKIELVMHSVNIFNMLNRLVDTMTYELLEKKLSISVLVDEKIPEWVIGDESRLNQILLNILSNAVKFTYKGGITVTLSYKGIMNEQDWITIAVKDTGIGVKEEQVEAIFDEFTQANMSINREFGGTGLGLAITKRLVDAMGGDITFESHYGIGTTVSVTLPFQKSHQRVRYIERSIKIALITSQPEKFNYLHSQFKKMGTDCRMIQVIDRLQFNESYDYVLIDWNQRLAELPILIHMVKDRVRIGTPIELITESRDWHIQAYIENQEEITILFLPMSTDRLLKHIMDKKSEDQICKIEDARDKKVLLDKKILVVEDNNLNQDIERSILEDRGAKVIIANDGKEAVEIMNGSCEFDLILMDIHMPIMDGYDAAKEIRLLGHEKRIPIIAMTADVQVGVKDKVKNAGMDDYIKKPINVSEVYTVIGKWIR